MGGGKVKVVTKPSLREAAVIRIEYRNAVSITASQPSPLLPLVKVI
jgi:hypothetical protein